MSLFPQIVLIDEIPENSTGLVAVRVPLQNVLKDVSLLCLGSSGNLTLAKDVGIAVGKILKEKGVTYYVFGSFDVLRITDTDPLAKVSTSPYITAQVLSLLAEGLSTAGVVPVFSAAGEVNEQVISALITRKATYPMMVESVEKYERLKRLGYTTTLVIDTEGNVLVGKPLRFSWAYEKEIDYESLRREVLENSIVLLDRNVKKISVNDPWSGGVLVFSDEEWLLKIAQDVLDGRRAPTGRTP